MSILEELEKIEKEAKEAYEDNDMSYEDFINRLKVLWTLEEWVKEKEEEERKRR